MYVPTSDTASRTCHDDVHILESMTSKLETMLQDMIMRTWSSSRSIRLIRMTDQV